MLPIPYSCWWPGDLRSQGISRHGIDQISQNISSLAEEELIPSDMLNSCKVTWYFISFFYCFFILRWHRAMKSFLMEDEEFTHHNQYNGYWWPGDTKSHGIDIVLQEYCNLSSKRVKIFSIKKIWQKLYLKIPSYSINAKMWIFWEITVVQHHAYSRTWRPGVSIKLIVKQEDLGTILNTLTAWTHRPWVPLWRRSLSSQWSRVLE